MSSKIEQLVIEAITPGETKVSLDILFLLLGFSVVINLFFWIIIDSYHFLVLAVLSGGLLYLFAEYRVHFDSSLREFAEEAGESEGKEDKVTEEEEETTEEDKKDK